MKFKTIALALSMSLLATPMASFAKAPKSATPQELAAYNLMVQIKSAYPDTTITAVNPTPMEGVFEVVMGKNIGYTNTKGTHFIFGNLFDMKAQTNLTEMRMEQLNRIDMKLINKANGIKTVKGNGKRELHVFADPDCGFCKRLEQTLRDVTDVTIYTYLFPLDSIHPTARATAESIWCTKNQSKAWDDYMLREIKPKPATCKNPIQANVDLGSQLGIGGTPTLINAEGRMRAGAIPFGQLNDFLGQ